METCAKVAECARGSGGAEGRNPTPGGPGRTEDPLRDSDSRPPVVLAQLADSSENKTKPQDTVLGTPAAVGATVSIGRRRPAFRTAMARRLRNAGRNGSRNFRLARNRGTTRRLSAVDRKLAAEAKALRAQIAALRMEREALKARMSVLFALAEEVGLDSKVFFE